MKERVSDWIRRMKTMRTGLPMGLLLCSDVGNRDVFAIRQRNLPLHKIGRGGTEAPVRNCWKPWIAVNLKFLPTLMLRLLEALLIPAATR